jgi:hypothetical protein
LVTKIDEPEAPFGGTSTMEIVSTANGSRLTITERGEIYNPISGAGAVCVRARGHDGKLPRSRSKNTIRLKEIPQRPDAVEAYNVDIARRAMLTS